MHLELSLPAEGSVLRMRARGAPARPSGSRAVVSRGSSWRHLNGRPRVVPCSPEAAAFPGCESWLSAKSEHPTEGWDEGERRPPGEVPTGTELRAFPPALQRAGLRTERAALAWPRLQSGLVEELEQEPRAV